MDEERDEIEPFQDEEDEREAAQYAREGVWVREMIETKGWSKVIEPRLMQRRQSLLNQLLSADKHEDVIRIQQAVNAIDNLMNFIAACIKLGSVSGERLRAARKQGANFQKE